MLHIQAFHGQWDEIDWNVWERRQWLNKAKRDSPQEFHRALSLPPSEDIPPSTASGKGRGSVSFDLVVDDSGLVVAANSSEPVVCAPAGADVEGNVAEDECVAGTVAILEVSQDDPDQESQALR